MRDEFYQESAKTLSLMEQKHSLKPLVLIVAGDEDTCTMLRLWLEIWKFRSVETKDNLEAVDIAKDINPNIILLDVSSINKDKFETIYQIQNNSYLKTTPIILVSSHIHFNNYSITYKEEKFNVLPINFSCLEKVFKEHLYTNNLYAGNLPQ